LTWSFHALLCVFPFKYIIRIIRGYASQSNRSILAKSNTLPQEYDITCKSSQGRGLTLQDELFGRARHTPFWMRIRVNHPSIIALDASANNFPRKEDAYSILVVLQGLCALVTQYRLRPFLDPQHVHSFFHIFAHQSAAYGTLCGRIQIHICINPPARWPGSSSAPDSGPYMVVESARFYLSWM
jgi:hypothetical protein